MCITSLLSVTLGPWHIAWSTVKSAVCVCVCVCVRVCVCVLYKDVKIHTSQQDIALPVFQSGVSFISLSIWHTHTHTHLAFLLFNFSCRSLPDFQWVAHTIYSTGLFTHKHTLLKTETWQAVCHSAVERAVTKRQSEESRKQTSWTQERRARAGIWTLCLFVFKCECAVWCRDTIMEKQRRGNNKRTGRRDLFNY